MKKHQAETINWLIVITFSILGLVLGILFGITLINNSTEVRSSDLIIAYIGLPAFGIYVLGFLGIILGQKVQDKLTR